MSSADFVAIGGLLRGCLTEKIAGKNRRAEQRSGIVDQGSRPRLFVWCPIGQEIEKLHGAYLVGEGEVRIVAAPDQPIAIGPGEFHPGPPLAVAQQTDELLEARLLRPCLGAELPM